MMLEKIGEPAMLEQFAEECTEAAKAALKKARILRGENPTPVTLFSADTSLREEFTDVAQCAWELGIEPDKEQIRRKQERFEERWKEFACCPECGLDTGGKFTVCPRCGHRK